MTRPSNSESSAPESMVREVIEQWRGGARPDAAGFLTANPELQERKSLAMDLIYEEYCLRAESGETLVPSTFCQKFPAYRQSLQRLIDVHQFLDANPEPTEEKKQAPWSWPEPGENVLGFKIIQKLGEGAIAKVYLAQQPDLGQRLVVVKISRHGATEAKLLGKLEHPSIVPVHSVHQDAVTGLTCICMPFLGTATLVDLYDSAFSKGQPPQSAAVIGAVARQFQALGSREADLPVAASRRRESYVEGVVGLGVQLAEALATAHEAGVMHRDIKPSNVLLSRSGRPMLLDFNLSSDLEMPLERVGGTVAYMAPERIAWLIGNDARSESKIDPRGDVYSLAAVLYELLCGELPSRPQVAPGKQARLEEWLKGRLTAPPSPSSLNPDVDRKIASVVLKALSPCPVDRYASAAEFGRALAETLSWKSRSTRFLSKNRRAVVVCAASMLALMAISAGVWASGESYENGLMRLGREAYLRKDYKAAAEHFGDVLRLRPDQPAALFARAQALRQAGEFALAKRDYEVVHAKTGNPELLFYVGHCELKQGYFNPAVGNYDQAVQNGWTSSELLHNKAYCYNKRKDSAGTIKTLNQLLSENPAKPLYLSHHLLARTEFFAARKPKVPLPLPPDTIAHLEKALEGPEGPMIHLDAACIYMHKPGSTLDEQKALNHLRLAIKNGASKFAVENVGPLLGNLLQRLSDEERTSMADQPQELLVFAFYYEPSPDLALPNRQIALAAAPR